MIRSATLNDAKAICEVYNHYVLNTHHNFEEEAVTPGEMAERITTVLDKHYPWLVYEEGNEVIGYAYVSDWKSRCSYRFSAESSVYLKHGKAGKGVGSRLYERLLEEVAKTKVHALIGGIALPNEASIRLHEKFGFEKIAQFREVGNKFGKWIDVGYWEKIMPGNSNNPLT